MNTGETHPKFNPLQLFSGMPVNTSGVFMSLLLTALVSIEIFNYSTTDYALSDLLGDISFAGMRWAILLAIAFCGIDFAGVRLNLPQDQSGKKTKGTGYLLGVWITAATMNAVLTWWGLSMAMANQPIENTHGVDAEVLTAIVPIFVAVLAGLIRILIIGTLAKSLAGNDLLASGWKKSTSRAQLRRLVVPLRSASSAPVLTRPVKPATAIESSPLRPVFPMEPRLKRPEATFQPIAAARMGGVNQKSANVISESRQM